MNVTTPTDREIVLTKEFAAPRQLVFDAHTKPELLKRWFGPHDWRLAVCEIDLRPGGTWYYLMRSTAGAEMTLRGSYVEITPPARLVTTESNVDCDARAEHESLATLELVEHAGGTTLTNTLRFPTKEIRDAVLASGMDRGVGEGFERLAVLLAGAPEASPPPRDLKCALRPGE
ncbi:SRPBCC family protein [Actinophytocola sp.]|uniref:SRPBCC family protein n=1 Tax=Actinophytocola sp. TaxID=1872138 RepID=UPI002EDA5E10